MSLEAQAADTPPDNLSRRHLMRQAAAVGAAGLAVNLLAGTGTALARPAEQHAAGEGAPAPAGVRADHAEPMIVHLRDARSGDLDLYSGDRHQRVQDPALAAALVRALG
ncbi:hypothetical protein OG500_03315 [Kitasatospora sp. NBC_01250]|uniref:hypothetical protein n=1 Tax=unclassified Kitasatospora TaxID=2633591 RepID=UPI002E14F4A0|nr:MULTISPECIES: hypothetical protein [unclassified Kitasatospora]WSJ65194.1 hypothetical protein OG294_03275 [Kitasatospora sp. NBC_01302]